jgi:hypothetical protein
VTFDAFDAWWWPYLFILTAGTAATDVWRFLGVYFSTGMAEDSEWLVLVRVLATALVAGVIGNLVVFPSGALAAAPLWLRVGSAAAGFLAYLAAGNRMVVGIIGAETCLLAGMLSGF